jgi:hypothetical protein
MKTAARFAKFMLLLSVAVTLSAQSPPFATGFKAPIDLDLTRHGHLIVVEAGNGPNTGRISLVERVTGHRRTLIDTLPSGIHPVTPPAPSGPSGVFIQGGTVFITIGTGDSVLPGPLPGTETPNPTPSSPLLSSVLALRVSRPLELTAGGFVLEPSHHARLKDGETLSLSNGAGETLEIRLVVDFPNFSSEPRPDFPSNVRLSNPFGVVAVGATLFVVDAGQNQIRKVDAVSGTFTTLTAFSQVRNPTPVGAPMTDAVPDSISLRGDKLLVTLLTGFPFPAGQAEVRTVDMTTGRDEPLIGGLTSAIDVVALGASPTSPMVVAEFSTAQMQGQPGRIRLATPNAPLVTIAEGLITPTAIAVDPQSGEIFVTLLGPGIVARIDAKELIPRGAPRAIIPAVASTSGAFGSRFRTSLQISNPHPFPISGRIVFHGAGMPSSSSDPALTYSLAPFETRSYSDVVLAMGASGLGTADVITTGGDAPSMIVQVFEEGGANVSVLMPVVSPASALVAGREGALITPADPVQNRFNVGIRSLESGVSLTVRVYDTAGVLLRTTNRDYPRHYFVQTPLAELTGAAAGANQSVIFTVTAGSAIVYGSSADNSGRGMTIQIASPVIEE